MTVAGVREPGQRRFEVRVGAPDAPVLVDGSMVSMVARSGATNDAKMHDFRTRVLGIDSSPGEGGAPCR